MARNGDRKSGGKGGRWSLLFERKWEIQLKNGNGGGHLYLAAWISAKQLRSSEASFPDWVYQLPVGIDGLTSLAYIQYFDSDRLPRLLGEGDRKGEHDKERGCRSQGSLLFPKFEFFIID